MKKDYPEPEWSVTADASNSTFSCAPPVSGFTMQEFIAAKRYDNANLPPAGPICRIRDQMRGGNVKE